MRPESPTKTYTRTVHRPFRFAELLSACLRHFASKRLADEWGDKPNCLTMKQLFSANRGIEPKRPITFDKTQFDPVPKTPDILNKTRNGGYATYETAKDNLLTSGGKLLFPSYSKSLRFQTGTAFIAPLYASVKNLNSTH